MYFNREYRTRVWLILTITLMPATAIADTGIDAFHRVICLQQDAAVRVAGRETPYQAQFGELFKVARADGEDCIVYNARVEGAIAKTALANIADPLLLNEIETSQVPEGQREYALGNYFLRRDRVSSATHFQRSVDADPRHGLARFEWTLCLRLFASEADYQNSLEKLKLMDGWSSPGIVGAQPRV